MIICIQKVIFQNHYYVVVVGEKNITVHTCNLYSLVHKKYSYFLMIEY